MKILQEKYQNKLTELEAALQTANLNGSQKIATLSQEYAETKNILDNLNAYLKKAAALTELQSTAATENDEEMKNLMAEEITQLETELAMLKDAIDDQVRPQDPRDKKNCIMEIRGGAGGDESALFAADLFRMYSRYAEKNNWRVHILSSNRTELGGLKEIIFEVLGNNVYGQLKYESGTHRVQRVPETEKSGRIHTSTATVAVMPEAEEIDLVIEPKDLRIDTYCASGNGGQSVNTTYSAVRITHLPTNTVVTCQDEKSQQQNRLKAIQVLRSRLLQKIEDERRDQESAARQAQIGNGDRAEKIRTYNWPQDRLTDHRIKLTVHNLNTVLDGEIGPIITELKKAANAQQRG